MSASGFSSHYTPDTITMPFGKFKDLPLTRIPAGYLEWALRETSPQPWLEEAIRAELCARATACGERQPHERQRYQARVPSHADPEVMLEVVRAGRRSLALARHP